MTRDGDRGVSEFTTWFIFWQGAVIDHYFGLEGALWWCIGWWVLRLLLGHRA